MKKLLLVCSVSLLTLSQVSAQSCTPGANYADSTYGVWPDTVQNFPPAAVGVAYSTDLNFKVPDQVTAEVAGSDPAAQAVIGSAIQDFTVYPITIDVEATVLVELIPGFPTPLTVPTSFSGYKLAVGNAGQIEGVIQPIAVHPNPANQNITVSGLNPLLKVSSINITNMSGKIVKSIQPNGSTVEVSLDGIAEGMYFVAVEHATGRELVKFIKN